MKKLEEKKNSYKKYKFTYINATIITLFVCLLFVRGYTSFEKSGENLFHIQVNGQDVGTLGDKSRVGTLLLQARRNVASASDELVFMEPSLEIVGEEVLWGEVDTEKEVLQRMEDALESGVQVSLHRSYALKIDEYMVNLASMEDVRRLLQAAIDKYGNEGKFAVALGQNTDREFSVLDANVVAVSQLNGEEEKSYLEGGIQTFLSGLTGTRETEGNNLPSEEKDFEDFDLGILTMDFSEKVEIVEVYLPESQLTPLEDALNLVIMEQETPSIYEVVAGDTLSGIAIKVNIPMDKIIEMNDILEDENTTLHIGDELFITIPEPELSVTRVEEEYYEEVYEADVVYIDNDNWYTNKSEVRQVPHAGFRKVVADVSYVNDKEVSREILKEEILMPAVAKVVERGTIVPPTYIKPLSGGIVSSGFGPRSAPVKGASTYHKGVDWATPTGTTVYASSGGTVSRAGWGSGYGYVIYIDHPDGRQTRYAHLSKILVKVGQQVKQSEKIALSGATGNVSGPHVHFEILINGKQVDPLKHIDR